MEKLNSLLTFYLVLISAGFIHSQDVIINSQNHLDSFDPTTTIINGDLIIRTYPNSQFPITDLSNLSNITSVTWDLIIENNHSLQDLDELSNITSVGRNLWILNNTSLQDLAGLSNITTVEEDLRVYNNDNLQDLNGLSNIISVEGDLNVNNNDNLQDLGGLSNITFVGEDLWIFKNDNLQDLDGLSNITSIGGGVWIIENDSLQNLDGLFNITSISGDLYISDNHSLQHLDGLSNITSLGEDLAILSNDNLEDLDGLSNITSVEGGLNINNNDNLQDLGGLSNLTSVGGFLGVYNNDNLSDCCGIQALLGTQNAIEGSITIYNNLFPCNSEVNISAVLCDTTILYVDASSQGLNTGNSWTHALTDLQDALSSGTGKTIHIAEGTYLPTIEGGQRGISFDIPDNTTLIGGYPTGVGNQNPELYETILTGNIDPNSINGDSYHVVTIKDVTNVTIEGLTIRNGNADDTNSYARSRGGGVYINNSTAEFKNVTFKWNRSIYGGAMFSKFSDVSFEECSFKKNRSDYGAAMYYSNASNINLLRSEIIENTSNNRCAIESNNASSTIIKNSLIANNASTNANAFGIIATNRNANIQILNSTILGGNNNKNLITYQVGNNDELDVTINNSIIGHQNPSFDKNMVAYNFNILNLNHNNSYFSGSSAIGNGTNALYADTAGDLLLNTDYTLDECSPAVNAGNDALGTGSQDYFGNPRYFNTIDIGAYEAQAICMTPRKPTLQDSKELNMSLFPNPATEDFILRIKGEEEIQVRIYDALSREVYQGGMQDELTINTKGWFAGIYHIVFLSNSGEIRGNHKILIRK